MDLDVALRKCGGAARWGRLRGLDVPAHLMRDSELAVGHGSFALPGAPPALVTAVRLGGVASHASAAALHGFGSWRPDPTLQVTVTGARAPEPGVRLHRARLRPADVDTLRPLTSPLRTLLDCGRVLPLVEAVVVLDAALNGGVVRRSVLRAAAAAARGHGAAALRRAVRFADELADSPLESVLRLLMDLLGLIVVSQVKIRGVGRVDFVIGGWLVIEADGFEFHSDRRAYQEDRRRGNALAAQGKVYLRFTWEDVRFRPGWVLATIEQTLQAGPRGAGPRGN